MCHKFENPKLHKQMSIPSVMVPDPYQSSVVDTAYAHKVAQPPIRSEWRTFIGQGSNGMPSGNQSVFNVFPPSNTTIVDRRMILRLEVTVTGTVDDANVTSALRAFPVNNVVNQVNVVINGSGGFVSQNNDIIYPLKRYIKEKEKTYYNSPTMLDTNGDFSTIVLDYDKNDGLGTPFFGLLNTTTGADETGLAPLSSNRIRPSEPSRAQFPSESFTSATRSIRKYVISEVILNGVLGDAGDEVALTNISKLDITVLYESVQNMLLMSSPKFATLPPTVSITKAELLCHFITPSITTLPSVFTTGFKQYTLNSQAVVITSAATTKDFSVSAAPFTNLTLNTVPEFFYVYVKPQKGVLTGARGDQIGEWTGRITNISINLGTSFGHLSQMDEHTLYLMSRDNGYNAGGFEQWQRMGSVLCIDAAKDLGLVPGQNRYLPIDFTVTFKNPTTSPPLGATKSLAMEICLLSVIPGTVNIAPDQCTSFLGFTAQDQGNAANDDKVTQTVMVPQTSSGSGFNSHGGKLTWSGVWKGIKQGVRYAAPVLQNLAASTGNPLLTGVAGAAGMASDALGSGYKRRRMTGSGLLLG